MDVTQHSHLGLTLSSNLSWKDHTLKVYEKACRRLNLLKGLKFILNRGDFEHIIQISYSSINGVWRCLVGWLNGRRG